MKRVSGVLCILTILAQLRAEDASADEARERGPDATLAAKTDAYLAPYIANRDFSGAVLIADDDRILFRKAYGMANYALGAPNATNTRFAIASVTKTFTAAAVVMLQESGKLRFNDPLSKFLPDYPKGNKITLRHLLEHASGVPNPDYDTIFFKQLTPDQLIDAFRRKPLDFEPGTNDRYSNAGYILLARVVEKASGQPFEQFLRDRIFVPLGMSDTGMLDRATIIPNLAGGYVPGPAPVGLENAAPQNPSTLFGSGCLYSTVDDLHRWAKAVRSERLYKRTRLSYPFGWGVRKQYGHVYHEQSGYIPGFTSHVIVYLDQPRYVICLTNVESGLFNRVERDLTNLAFGGAASTRPPALRAATLDPKALAGFVGRYRGPFFSLRVTEENGMLFCNFDESPGRVYLLPTSRDELFMRSAYARIQATRDDHGQVTQLAITWGGGGDPMKLPRIKEAPAAGG